MSATFQLKEGKFIFNVKSEYKQQPKVDLATMDAVTLFQEHNFVEFLHNETGPAIHNTEEGDKADIYFLNGRIATDEEKERIMHNYKFNTKLDESLKEDDSK